MTNWSQVLHAVNKAVPGSPTPKTEIVSMFDDADRVFAKYGFDTIRRQGCIIGHIAVESGWFTTIFENLNYSPAAMMRAWPKRFPNEASCIGFAHNPKALANKVYGGRMGNRPGTDDGWDMRGAGLLQNTGRDNMAKLAKKLGCTPEEAAKRLVDPATALECVCVIFLMLGVMPFADSGDVTRQCEKINGGRNGLAERQKTVPAAIKAIARLRAVAPAESDAAPAVIDAPAVTLHDMRKAGTSRTIVGAGKAKGGALTQAATVVAGVGSYASTINDLGGKVQSAVETATSACQSVSAFAAWAGHNHQLLIALAIAALGSYAVWRTWSGASLVERARVEDEALGLHL